MHREPTQFEARAKHRWLLVALLAGGLPACIGAEPDEPSPAIAGEDTGGSATSGFGQRDADSNSEGNDPDGSDTDGSDTDGSDTDGSDGSDESNDGSSTDERTSGGGAESASPIELGSSLRFETRNQALLQPGEADQSAIELDWAILDESVSDSIGRIVEDVELSTAIAQQIWDTALAECRKPRAIQGPADITVRVTPTQAECETGLVTLCFPLPFLLPWRRIGPNDSCLGIWVQRDVASPGLGPRPTRGTTRPIALGAQLESHVELSAGLKATLGYDLGSVDVEYGTEVELRIDRDRARPGEEVEISTSQRAADPYAMASRSPYLELALELYAALRGSVMVDIANVDRSNGKPIRRQHSILDIDAGVPKVFGDGELVRMRMDVGGIHTSLLGEPLQSPVASRELHITYPFDATEPAGKKAPPFKMPASFSLAEFSLLSPRLDTPAAADFACGDCTLLRNLVTEDGSLVSNTPVGRRQLLGGIHDGDGWTLPLVNEGLQDTDLLRMDLDLDVLTVAAGVPLGAVFDLFLLSGEVNLADLDLAYFMSVAQELHFQPNLQVRLDFSEPVLVELDGDYIEVRSYLLPVGQALTFLQPDADVRIEPTYTLANNRFTNETALLGSSALQLTLLQLKLGGLLVDRAAEELDLPTNYAAVQLTPTLGQPHTIWSNGAPSWELAGFKDVAMDPISVVTVR